MTSTSEPNRRAITLCSIDELVADVRELVAAEEEGNLKSLGNWSLGQCLQHLARTIEFSIDGFPFKYPMRLRIAAFMIRLVSWRLLAWIATRPGFRNPRVAARLQPDDLVATDEGLRYFQTQVDRIANGDRMCQASPAEGRITHEQWMYFHLRHAELHLSFHIPVGLFDFDSYANDPRGGVYFRTATGADGIGPDRMSYGLVFRPNAEGSPFGNAHYDTYHLFEDWHTFEASDDW